MITRGRLQLLVGLSLFSLLALHEFVLRGRNGFQNSQPKSLPYHNYGREKLWPGASRLEVDSTKPNCLRHCGNVSIPYPFGLSPECAQSPYFVLNCTYELRANISAEGEGPWPLLTYGSGTYTVDRYNTTDETHVQQEYAVNAFQVQRIDPGSMVINVTAIKAMGCFNQDGKASVSLDLASPYWIHADNQFFVAGCRSSCNISGSGVQGSCGPLMCANQNSIPYCTQYDCCVQPIQWAKKISLAGGGIGYNLFENCGFCSIIYPDTFRNPAPNGEIGRGTYGLKLDWGLQTSSSNCSAAQLDTESYECSQHATCKDSYQSHFCLCDFLGYEGDGYKNGTGCEDIDECVVGNDCTEVAQCGNFAGSYNCTCPPDMTGNGIDKKLNVSGTDCAWINKCDRDTLNDCSKDAKCTFNDTNGQYSCSCQGDTVGDGHDGKDGTGCKSKSNTGTVIGAVTGSVIGFLAINVVVWWFIYRRIRRRRAIEHELALFSAKELLDELEKHEGAKYCKIFTYDDLQEATTDFSLDRKLGAGGFGTVFKGILKDGTTVAIKRADRGVGETRNDVKQFVNEIVILSQVNHRNLVRLVGCCLETPVPVLVFEFVPNGDLQGHISVSSNATNESDTKVLAHPPLYWNQRLKIALETAEALNYLHWGTSPPIYHHDVKCANILLDNDYNVKVADFGLSKLVSLDSEEAATKVLGGTPGYLDPAYFDTWELTDKSDVYSYGIVLLVLLTAQKPVDFTRQARDQNLAVKCGRLMAQGLLILNLDPELGSFLQDSNTVEAIHGVAKVAMKCVNRSRDDRPTMKEVLMELRAIEITSRERKSRKSKHSNLPDDNPVPPHAESDAHSNTLSSLSQSLPFLAKWSDSDSSRGQRAETTSVFLGRGEDEVSPR